MDVNQKNIGKVMLKLLRFNIRKQNRNKTNRKSSVQGTAQHVYPPMDQWNVVL